LPPEPARRGFFSLFSSGGESWGEEAFTKESPKPIEQPLSPALSPLVTRGARETTFAFDRFMGRENRWPHLVSTGQVV
jgi:hypothetical protein